MSRTLKVTNTCGIHARPAALIVQAATAFRSELFMEKDGNCVSCKSIMGVMAIEGFPGSVMTVTASGDDAEAALDVMEELFANRFNEE